MTRQGLLTIGVFALGLSIFAIGVWQVFWPAAMMLVGAILMMITVIGGRNEPTDGNDSNG